MKLPVLGESEYENNWRTASEEEFSKKLSG